MSWHDAPPHTFHGPRPSWDYMAPPHVAEGWDEDAAREHLANLDREIYAYEARADWLEKQAYVARDEAQIRRGQRERAAAMFASQRKAKP